MHIPSDAAALIQPIVDGIFEEPLWGSFLDQLRARTRSGYVSIVLRPLPFGPAKNRVVHLYSGQPSPPLVSQHYHDTLHISDPMPYLDMADGRLYALSELLEFGNPEHDAYRSQLLTASGMNVLRMMRVVEPSGISAWLTVARREGEFDASADAVIAAIGPALRSALRCYVALERERDSASLANEAIRRMNFGWLTLGADGRILDADAHGESLLGPSGQLFRGRGGKLAAHDSEVNRDINEAVRALALDPQSRPRAIVLSREPWLDMLLVPSTIRPGTTRPAPALVAYVHADNWSSSDRCDQLGQMFDLIPSEARLALALSRGMSIAEAAIELGLTVESARTYSKRIYAKTGARGQADLVRFIHRSVLAIA